MANVIKYIYTSVPANTVQTFPFVVGVNFGGYGSTAATGFWNGKTPNVGGYVVYVSVNPPPSSPTIYVADNDTQLINLCNQFFGTGVSTIGAALQTFNGSTSTCCVNVDYPNIVTTNIGPNLDASYTPSYPRTGTSWTDISGSLNSGTLVNGTTYSSDGGGSLLFDGVDDCVTIPTITLGNGNISWTINAWIKTTTTVNGLGQGSVISNSSSGPVYSMLGVNGGKIVYWTYQNSNWAQKLGNTTINDGNWHMLTWVNYNNYTMDMYVDGVLDASVANSTSGNNNPLDIIGSSWAARYNGNISNLFIYQNKSLELQEVLQNYYAGLQRFIPTGGLVLYLDGNNTNKQVMTASTANDISGNNTTGILTNGVTLVRDGQRSFSFDGTNDYIDLGSSTLLGAALTNVSISIWFKINTTPVGSNTIIKFGASNAGWAIGISSSGLYYSLYTTTVNFLGGGIPVGGSISLNVWHNVTLTFINSSTLIMYLDGVVVANTTSTLGNIVNGGSNLINIGRDGSINTNYFNGYISVVRGYSQTLTAAQVLTIYNAGKGRYGL